MRTRSGKIILIVFAISLFLARAAWCSNDKPKIIEETKTVMGSAVRIQVAILADKNEVAARAAIDEAFDEAAELSPDKVSLGGAIEA